MKKDKIRQMPKEKKIDLFQTKYEYYRRFVSWMITVSTISYLAFFFTDCGIFGRFAYETVLARSIVLVPYIVFEIMNRKVKDYRILVIAMYLIIHMIIWGTDWATYLLPDRQYAISGMIIMNLIFACAGFAAPFHYSLIAHALFILDILIANLFIHYDNLPMMLLFNITCVIAICVMHYLMQEIFLEQYVTKCKLKDMAVLDQLTGVGNRNKFKEIVNPDTGELLLRDKGEASILLMDIDYFKNINDKFGHEKGDVVLEHMGRILLDSVRSTDYVIRWGGEEFLILMPECEIEDAARVAELIRKKVEDSDCDSCHVTISVGISFYRGGDCHIAIRKADEALYQAKKSGRNQVVVHPFA